METPGAGAGEAPILARSGGWVLSLHGERGDATPAAAGLQNARCPDRVGLLIARKLDSSHHPMFSGFIGAIQCRLKKYEPLAFKCQVST